MSKLITIKSKEEIKPAATIARILAKQTRRGAKTNAVDIRDEILAIVADGYQITYQDAIKSNSITYPTFLYNVLICHIGDLKIESDGYGNLGNPITRHIYRDFKIIIPAGCMGVYADAANKAYYLGYWHPHVGLGGDICFGEGGDAAEEALYDSRLKDVVDIALAVLSRESNNPYIYLREIVYGSRYRTCNDCGEQNETVRKCVKCGGYFCCDCQRESNARRCCIC